MNNFKFIPKTPSKAVILPEDALPPEPKPRRKSTNAADAPLTLSECLKQQLDERKTQDIAKRLIAIATDEDARTSDNLTAIKLIFERMEGTARSTVDLNVAVNPLQTMTREQLRQYLAAQGLAAVTNDAVAEIEAIAQDEGEAAP